MYTFPMRLLLHACCAPCSVQWVAAVKAESVETTLFAYNPNIHPMAEYRARLESLSRLAACEDIPLVIRDEYGLRRFLGAVLPAAETAGAADGPAPQVRCPLCYRLRLEACAAEAARRGFDAFSSTLLISPYQNHELLRHMGEEIAARYGLEFFYRDLRSRFWEGQKIARERGYYMQKHCGCIFSEEEAESARLQKQAARTARLEKQAAAQTVQSAAAAP